MVRGKKTESCWQRFLSSPCPQLDSKARISEDSGSGRVQPPFSKELLWSDPCEGMMSFVEMGVWVTWY